MSCGSNLNSPMGSSWYRLEVVFHSRRHRAPSMLMPISAGSVLHGGPHTFGFLMGAVEVGALTSALLLAARKSGRARAGDTTLLRRVWHRTHWLRPVAESMALDVDGADRGRRNDAADGGRERAVTPEAAGPDPTCRPFFDWLTAGPE